MRRSGPLTLIDAIVLAAIAGLALSFGLPAVKAAQERARALNTVNNLKMIGLALHNYHSTHNAFPMSEVDAKPIDQGDLGLFTGNRGRGHSVFLNILPFMENPATFNAYNFWVEPWSRMNSTATAARINAYLSDSDPDAAPVSAKDVRKVDGDGIPGANMFGPLRFGVNWGGDRAGWSREFAKRYPNYSGVMFKVHSIGSDGQPVRNVSIRDITDGSAFTIAVGEKRDAYGWALAGWGSGEFEPGDSPTYSGDDPVAQRAFCGSANAAGPAFCFVDGSVKRIKPKIARSVWHALLTRNGGEVVKPSDY